MKKVLFIAIAFFGIFYGEAYYRWQDSIIRKPFPEAYRLYFNSFQAGCIRARLKPGSKPSSSRISKEALGCQRLEADYKMHLKKYWEE